MWSEMENSMLRLSRMMCLDYEELSHESTSFVQLMKCHYSGGSQLWKWIPTKQQVFILPNPVFLYAFVCCLSLY